MKTDKVKTQILQLTKALERLEEAAHLPATQINQDATIQRFEFTFEISWKLMKTLAESNGLHVFSPREAIRTAAQLNLIDDIDQWFDFLEARNLSSHTYNQRLAKTVYRVAKRFIPAAKKFLTKVKQTKT